MVCRVSNCSFLELYQKLTICSAASCSVPLIYTAASLLAKDPKTGKAVPWNPSPQRWIDGSVDNDIPMTRLAEMFNVNHFIVSQVNPHVVPFLVKNEDAIGEETRRSSGTILPGPNWFNISHLAKSETLHRMHILADMGIFPNILTKTVSVLSQKYSGDITIFPEISYGDFPRMLSNPTSAFMHRAMLGGERATWPKMSIIKNHCAIELALDDAVQKLRARVAFSPSEVELRMRPRQTSDPRRENRKRTRLRRPLSQTSAPEGAVAHTTTPSIHTHSQSRTGRVAPNPGHKKSLSINTIFYGRSGEKQQLATSDHLPNPLHDVTSSGADETSNLTSSSSSTSFSSPTESPSSEEKWRRSLFGSASQLFFNYKGCSEIFTPASHSAKQPTPSPAFAMTPSKSSTNVSASSSEARYKRLFHHRPAGQTASKLLGRNRESKE